MSVKNQIYAEDYVKFIDNWTYHKLSCITVSFKSIQAIFFFQNGDFIFLFRLQQTPTQ